MSRSRFFNKKNEFLTLAQILEITGSKLNPSVSHSDLNKKVFDVATLEKADETQISFLNSGQYVEKLIHSKAGFCFVEEKYVTKVPSHIVAVIHKNPYFAYAKIASTFFEENIPEFSDKLIHPAAKIGANSRIAPNAYIGKNVDLGKNCYVGPNASIMDGCVIGDNSIINANAVISFAIIGSNCIIHNGATIGQDGFGFAHDAGINHKIIQLGIVEIGNSVEIGANTCIDRGAIENTIIGNGAKLDNLIQLAHNVTVGDGTLMAGCIAVAGSTKIGKFVQIGGAAVINGHITINDGAKIGGMSGVMRDVEPMQTVSGIPAIPIKKWYRLTARLLKMAERTEKDGLND